MWTAAIEIHENSFFLENSRTWKVLENHFGFRKSWKLKLKVLESPGKISMKVVIFLVVRMDHTKISSSEFWTANVHVSLHAEFSAIDYTLNIITKCCFFFFFYLNIRRLWKGPGRFFLGVLENFWIFFVSKRVWTLCLHERAVAGCYLWLCVQCVSRRVAWYHRHHLRRS